ncbi:MAG: amidohydrolase family protein, partial [Erysipelotrichaceae bacterium]|nr:amidohydrolase family protein [Erysipelotrichaceae bacterium]
ALYTATLNNAKLLGIDKETGSIEEGKSADFIVSEKDPLEGFDALRKLDMVVFRGKEYKDPVVKKNEICERELDQYLNTL